MTSPSTASVSPGPSDSRWSNLIPESEWVVYRQVLDLAMKRRIPFALGGGFAYSYYAQAWRDTKDIDLYILPEHREAMAAVLTESCFHDYFDKLPYDRRWIHRGHREGLITDLIWAMANQRSQVDMDWLQRGPQIELRGMPVRVIPVEELIWSKLYVLQRDRTDWPDMLTILYARGAEIDWNRFLDRLGDDVVLFSGVMGVFKWMCPGASRQLPGWLWSRLGLLPPQEKHDEAIHRARVLLLDSRDWFPPLRESDAAA